jgi:hypothetical protein
MGKRYDNDWGKGDNKLYQNPNFYWGQVIVDPATDPSGAGRCKIFIRELDREILDGGVDGMDSLKNPENYTELLKELPYSYPMQTKFFQSLPKVGETVLVVTNERQNERYNRFYIGPIVTQSQKLDGNGKVIGLLDGTFGGPNGLYGYETAWFDYDKSRLGGKDSPLNWSVFPSHPMDPQDISINGRGNEDIILRSSEKYDEVLLRVSKYGKNSKLNVNLKNPGYISLVSYDSSSISSLETDLTTVNVVADQINLVSHKGSKTRGKPSKGDGIILNSSSPEKQINLQNINLHPTVYGDVLWDVLKKLRVWVETHKHSGGGVAYTEPSLDVETTELISELDKALGSNPKEKVSPNGESYLEYQGNLISNNIKIN